MKFVLTDSSTGPSIINMEHVVSMSIVESNDKMDNELHYVGFDMSNGMYVKTEEFVSHGDAWKWLIAIANYDTTILDIIY